MANSERKECARAAQLLLRQANKASLGTLMPDGSPLVTLIALATMTYGTPLSLLSKISAHSRNLMTDPRASLLIEADDTPDDPMTGARLTLTGKVTALRTNEVDAAKQSFVARHPAAAPYDTELDFAYYRFEIAQARFNQGFGRFQKLGPAELLNAPTASMNNV